MKIALDTSALNPEFKAHAQRGIGRYVRELKSYFSSEDRPVKVNFFDTATFRNGPIDSVISRVPLGRQTLKQQLIFPFYLAKVSSGSDFIHFPAQMDAPAWGRRKYILTVHDLIPLVCADLYRSATKNWKFKFGRWLEICAIKNASHLIAISENTACDIERILNIPRERISVTHLGVDPKYVGVGKPGPTDERELRIRLRIPETRRIVLYVGGIDPRKNYVGLLETAARVVKRESEQGREPPCFVIAGNIEEDKEFPKLLALISKLGLEREIFLTGYVNDADLLALYGISAVLFFPSLYEGFGLTPLEALAAGLPVVASNTSAIPEVLGDAAVLVPPTDYDLCAQGIFSVLDNPEFAAKLSEKGRRRAKLFPWEKTGAETLKVYESL